MAKSVVISDELYLELQKIAQREGITVSEVVQKFFKLGFIADAIEQESAGLGGIYFKENHAADYIPLAIFGSEPPSGPDWLNDLDLFDDE